MDQLIDRMDLNQDGSIAFDEFSSALVDWKKVRLAPSAPPLPQIRAQASANVCIPDPLLLVHKFGHSSQRHALGLKCVGCALTQLRRAPRGECAGWTRLCLTPTSRPHECLVRTCSQRRLVLTKTHGADRFSWAE